MKALLDSYLPREFPDLRFQCVPHEGKSDLDKSIPRKLMAWREPDVHFFVVRDNDSADPIVTKRKLTALCHSAGRPDTVVRLVCQELEAWYLGDLVALGAAYGVGVSNPKNHKKYSNPDEWQKPSVEVQRMVPGFQKGLGARLVAKELLRDRNISHSFHAFIDAVDRVAVSLGYVNPTFD